MYNGYTCPLQPCTHLTLKLLIQGHPRSDEVTHIADLLLVLEVCNVKPTYRKSCAANLLMSDLTLDPSFKVKRGWPNLKLLITRLLLVLEVWDGKPTYRKSWAGNLFVWSDLTLGPLLQGQTRIAKLNIAYNSLIIGPRGLGW